MFYIILSSGISRNRRGLCRVTSEKIVNLGEDCFSIEEEYVDNLLKRHRAEHSSAYAYLVRAKCTSKHQGLNYETSILENSLESELVTMLVEKFCRLTFTLFTFMKSDQLRRNMRKFVHGWLWLTLDESLKRNNANRHVTACSSSVNNGSFSRFLSGFLFYCSVWKLPTMVFIWQDDHTPLILVNISKAVPSCITQFITNV
jgi:hypothetical protein